MMQIVLQISMFRRKGIIDLFDKYLEADEKGEYKLESDVHNLIFPMGVFRISRKIF